MSYRALSLVAVLALGLLAACVPQKPYSDSAFYGHCIMPFGPDPCDSDMEICKTFQTVFDTTFPDARACSAACDRIALDPSNAYTGRDCGYMLLHGGSLCSQQCERLYPKQK